MRGFSKASSLSFFVWLTLFLLTTQCSLLFIFAECVKRNEYCQPTKYWQTQKYTLRRDGQNNHLHHIWMSIFIACENFVRKKESSFYWDQPHRFPLSLWWYDISYQRQAFGSSNIFRIGVHWGMSFFPSNIRVVYNRLSVACFEQQTLNKKPLFQVL